MTKLSVNINKIATLRNARGGNLPNVLQVAIDSERFGADGITVHPRPDERHIRYADVRELKKKITTEFNIEGNPTYEKFVDLVLEVQPDQVTLVPDTLGQLTSDHGWNTLEQQEELKKYIALFKKSGIRTSLFLDPDLTMIEGAAELEVDRIELYTEDYAKKYALGFREKAIAPYLQAAQRARELGLGLNAGHDLDLENLHFLKKRIPWIDEVSIGHALIVDALYLGLEKTILSYQEALK